MPQTLILPFPDDWHVHLRDGAALSCTVPQTARHFARAIVMPNLSPPVVTVDQAEAYRARILAALPPGLAFEPLMVLYLTEGTDPEEIRRAAACGFVHAVKLYPAGATTHSDAGVRSLPAVYPVLEAMEEVGLPLLVHGEVVDPDVDVFDREQRFLERHLEDLVERFQGLKVVLEHVTTAEGVAFVESGPERVAGTLTAHHLLLNRNAMFQGGIRPHHYCLPVLKRERHRAALVGAATRGHPRFFLGTDSAPHPRGAKEAACGCAGLFTAPVALALYAEVFEDAGALGHLEAFAGTNGPDFYGLPRNGRTLRLVRRESAVPESMALGEEQVIPIRAGGTTRWSVET